ncbi:MAG: hypothetical protein ACYS8L_07915 [Planctomycetota bacterium]|jgi:hypothetical protein
MKDKYLSVLAYTGKALEPSLQRAEDEYWAHAERFFQWWLDRAPESPSAKYRRGWNRIWGKK